LTNGFGNILEAAICVSNKVRNLKNRVETLEKYMKKDLMKKNG
jgi:hypothetical protein